MDTVQQTQLFNNIAIVLAVTAITFLIVAVVLWFVFDIAHSIRVLTRIGTNKDVAITKTPGVQKSNAVLNWNTSEMLKTKKVYECPETEILDSSTELLNNETQLLTEVPSGFEIEEDIVITGTDRTI